MNTWDTNVANIFDVLRDFSAASVNTTDINLHKALRIALGEDPENVLRGRKVLSFYRCIANPTEHDLPPAIDRHLINLALGVFPGKNEQSALSNDDTLYSRIESVYMDLGRREGAGNLLASVAWFVQRRLSRSHQIDLYASTLSGSSLVCCGSPMRSHGRSERGARRFYCSRCKSTQVPELYLRLIRTRSGWKQSISYDGLKIWRDEKGRACVTLPKQHPYSNAAGYQRLARFLIAEDLGYLPHSSEHTHHVDRNLRNDDLENLASVSIAYHGRIHASAIFVGRAENGRFTKRQHNESLISPEFSWPRHGAVLGNQAKR